MKFSSGKIVFTCGVNAKITADTDFAEFVKQSLTRHFQCDWGDLSQSDKETNDNAFATDERVFSVYVYVCRSIWIITEANRSSTTVLFSAEY